MKKSFCKSALYQERAFTLVELLVVIVIIGILGSVITASLGSARKQARDAKRVADVKNIAQALEEYYADKGGYPVVNNGSQNSDIGICIEGSTDFQTMLIPGYLAAIPRDPLYDASDCTDYDSPNCHCYAYRTQGLTAATKDFKIFARAEATSSAAISDGGIMTFQASSPTPIGQSMTYLGLVGWWKFDEGSGTSISDSSGFGNSGTISLGTTGNTSIATAWVTGKVGYALSFDGSDDYVSISNADLQKMGTNDFTVSGWVYFYSNSGGGFGGGCIMGGPSLIPGWQVGIDWTSFEIYTRDSSGTTIAGYASSNISLNTWHYLTGVRNNTHQYIYLDGQLVSSATGTVRNVSNTDLPRIGKCYSGASTNGLLDEIRLYNKALSATEVLQIYNSY